MKSILLDIKFKGNGIVNFDDSSRPLQIMKNLGIINYDETKYDNVKVAKHNYYPIPTTDDEKKDKWGYKVVVSSDCLRNAIFGAVPTNEITANDYLLHTYLTSPQAICRGYLFTGNDDEKSPKLNIKRASPLTITSAEQEDINTVFNAPKNTREGERNNTSLRRTEIIGIKNYVATGRIDLHKLMFISSDVKCDRLAFNPDMVISGKLSEFFTQNYGDVAKIKWGYFVPKVNLLHYAQPESGVLLNKELVDHLAKLMLHNIFNIRINRATATFGVETLRIKLVDDPYTQTEQSEEGWITINSDKDIDELPPIYPDEFYTEVTEKDIEDYKKAFADFMTELKEAKKKLKEAKKKADKTKKKNDETEELTEDTVTETDENA